MLTPHALSAVWLPTTTLQALLDAASPAIVAAGARHGITVNSLTVSTSPPDTVTMTADCTFTFGDGTIGVIETLGTTMVSWETGDPAAPTELTVPVVTKTTPFSSTDVVDDILEIIGTLFSPLALVFASVFAFSNIVAIVAADDAAGKASGILGPLLSSLPYAIPFPNTFITAVDPTDTNPTPFPVLSLNWTSFGTTEGGVVGGCVPGLSNRQQTDVSLTIEAMTKLTLAESQTVGQYDAQYSFWLQNLDPDSFTWTLSLSDVTRASATQPPATLAEGAIAAGPLTQAGGFTVPIRLPLGPGYLAVSVSASEACGTDPAKVLTAAWSSPVAVQTDPLPPGPGEPGHQPF